VAKGSREKGKTFQEVIKLLKKEYPNSRCSLIFRNPFEHLIATILSAQTPDARVNEVTPLLFSRFPDPYSLAKGSQKELEEILSSIGLYRTKGKNLIKLSRILVEKYGGEVPAELQSLLTLPGVGMKTALAVLTGSFSIPAGIVVDTHMFRIHRLLGLSSAKTPEKMRKELERWIPREEWCTYTYRVIDHGRKVCVARKPRCGVCVLNHLCKSAFSKKAGYHEKNDTWLPPSARYLSFTSA
jgi:endonuclease-3